jgi:tRNA pseudouridine55 synthase
VSFEERRCTVEVHCGKGYYVRSLARDLGRKVGVYGHISALRRTAVGPFAIERAVALDEAVERLKRGDVGGVLHAPDAILGDWPAVILGSDETADMRLGRVVSPLPRFAAVEEGSRARAYGPDGELVALAEAMGHQRWHPYRVFATETDSQ